MGDVIFADFEAWAFAGPVTRAIGVRGFVESKFERESARAREKPGQQMSNGQREHEAVLTAAERRSRSEARRRWGESPDDQVKRDYLPGIDAWLRTQGEPKP